MPITELPYLDRLKVPPTPERQLLIWIDDLFGQSVPGMVWEGTAEQLRALLCDEKSPSATQARRLIVNRIACGFFLGQLQKLFPHRFCRIRDKTDNYWRIKPCDPKHNVSFSNAKLI
jgi:hypothetical protein